MKVLVVGGGMFGAATARHLAGRAEVLVVGPDERADPATRSGPFSSHDDEGRIIDEFSPDPIWIELVRTAAAGIRELDPSLLVDCGMVTAVPAATAASLVDATVALRDWLGLDVHVVPADSVPGLRFRSDETLLAEPGAGHFSPRRYVALALADARANGVAVHEGVVRSLTPLPDGVRAELADGSALTAARAIVTAGAYSADLLPVRPSWRVKSEVALLAEVAGPESPAALPCVARELSEPDAGELYVLPPIRYPDGKTYLKCGANTLADRFLDSAGQIDAWYREGDCAEQVAVLRRVLTDLVPGLRASAWHAHRCVESYTTHGRPYLDRVADTDIYLAAGGNGHSAQVADAIGRLAADLVVTGEWSAQLPREAFEFVAEGAPWQGIELLRERRGHAVR